MQHNQPSLESREALLRLLDDPNPSVRKVLLAHFTAQGPAARDFLESIVKNGDRLLAGHARGCMGEWKNDNNRTIRRLPVDAEIPQGMGYRKLVDQWNAPNDGTYRLDEPKGYRK